MLRGYKKYAFFSALILCFFSLPKAVVPVEKKSHIGVDSIQFENIFPDSSYRRVLRLCISVWHTIRAVQNPMVEDQLKNFNLSTIKDLIVLHNDIDEMLHNKNSCSPDDLEYLIGILCVMQGEYMLKQTKQPNHEVVCATVLFRLLKSKLEQILQVL
jgi:hypothetical protein